MTPLNCYHLYLKVMEVFVIFANGVENTGQSAKRREKPGLGFYRPRSQKSRDE